MIRAFALAVAVVAALAVVGSGASRVVAAAPIACESLRQLPLTNATLIVAGDASWDQMRLCAARVALDVFVNREPAAVIPPAKYPMIHNAVLNACDAADA